MSCFAASKAATCYPFHPWNRNNEVLRQMGHVQSDNSWLPWLSQCLIRLIIEWHTSWDLIGWLEHVNSLSVSKSAQASDCIEASGFTYNAQYTFCAHACMGSIKSCIGRDSHLKAMQRLHECSVCLWAVVSGVCHCQCWLHDKSRRERKQNIMHNQSLKGVEPECL